MEYMISNIQGCRFNGRKAVTFDCREREPGEPWLGPVSWTMLTSGKKPTKEACIEFVKAETKEAGQAAAAEEAAEAAYLRAGLSRDGGLLTNEDE